MNHLKSKKILVTGAAGTIGSELIEQIINNDTDQTVEITGIDSNESELFFLEQKYVNNKNVKLFLSDIKNKDACYQYMEGIDIVFHTAALKHVTLCEKSPMQSVYTNIIGLQNMISAAEHHKIEKFIFTSSDKAVNPTNVMGTTKLMGERLVTAANSNQKEKRTIFASTRFGNVLGSNGSVIPIFKNQIKAKRDITLTDEKMTRFVMSTEDAVKLVIDSAFYAQGGEVFITKMPVIRIKDLAEVMISELAPKYGNDPESYRIQIIGSKPGEKLYEELMSAEETGRAVELDSYFSVLPAFRSIYYHIEYGYENKTNNNVTNPYISELEIPMSKEELKIFLYKNKLI